MVDDYDPPDLRGLSPSEPTRNSMAFFPDLIRFAIPPLRVPADSVAPGIVKL